MHYICTVCRCFGNCSIGTPPSFPPALRETRNKKKKKKKKKYSLRSCTLSIGTIYTVILRETKIHSFQGFKIKGQ